MNSQDYEIIYNFFISEQGLQMDEGAASINAKRLGELLKEAVYETKI